MTDAAYPTPEEAALAQWDGFPVAAARVVGVRYEGVDRAIVVTDTVPSHPMQNACRRTPRGWLYAGEWS